MKKALDKLNFTKILPFLMLASFGTGNTNLNKSKEFLIGTWTIVSSTFNDKGSPVPKNTSLEFTSDRRIKVLLLNFGENNEDIIALGTWNKSEGFVKIEWDNEQLWETPELENIGTNQIKTT